MGEMSDEAAGSRDGHPQPASGPLDEATADWYVRYTGGQFQAFLRDGRWYLYTPDRAERPAAPGHCDE